MSWYPNDSSAGPSQPGQRPNPGDPGDDDPTIARPGLRQAGPRAEDDNDPTIPRPSLDERPAPVLLDHRYRLIRQIGKGGMGEVWEARHEQLARAVAIKFLTSEEGGERFKREAQAIVSIRHSGVIDVLDFGETDRGVPYFVMELVEGETLSARVRRQGPLSWALVRNIALEITDALAHAHAAGVIHRDLKPSNVLVLHSPPPRGSSTKLIDFGIAKLLDARQKRLTKTGFIQGTPAYMSPEQVLGESVDGRADVYGLGCLLYYLLSGRKPFAGKAGTAALRAQLYEMPPSFVEAAPGVAVPPEVEALVFRAIAKQQGDRFASMSELQAAILAIPPDASASMSASVPPFHLWPGESHARHPADLTSSDVSSSGSIANMAASSWGEANAGASTSLTSPQSSSAASRSAPRSNTRSKLELVVILGGSLLVVGAAIIWLIWALTS